MHKCPFCLYRFHSAEDLERHLDEGRGCPEDQ